ncbi:MAG: TetR family transcriptional regulator [Chlorobiaceae bacterium]|nr:TetR family transcriptional regulator [Chlorobiaceae bacterium]
MRKKEGNKERDILEAAIKVFAKYGYHESKVSQISKEAEVSVGSIYVYYKSKEDILNKIFSFLWDKLYEKAEKIIADETKSPIEKLNLFIDTFFERFVSMPELAIVYVNEQRHMEMGKNLLPLSYYKYLEIGEQIISEGMKKKLYNPEVNVKVFRFFIIGGIRNLLEFWAKNQIALPFTELRKNVGLIIERGIGNH